MLVADIIAVDHKEKVDQYIQRQADLKRVPLAILVDDDIVGEIIIKNVCPARLLKNVQFSRENRVVNGRKTVVKYIVGVAV